MRTANNSRIKNMKADIVVIGGGGAGLTAAVSAVEAGIKNVVVLEKNNAPGGNSLFPGGLLGAETPLQRRMGADVTRDMVYKKAQEYAHWKLNGRLVRTLIERSAETISWLEGKGVVFEHLTPHYPNQVPNTFHSVGKGKTGAVVVRALVKACRGSGVNILLRTSATKILTDKRGKITGVLAENNGREFSISTGCVITATGGFTGNVELLKKYEPLYNEDEVIHGGMRHNGDGMLMAMEIGAATDQQVLLEMFAPQFEHSWRLAIASRRPAVVWVNKNGERFADENTISDMEAANIIWRQPRKLCYSLLDSEIMESIKNEQLYPLERMMINEESFRNGMDEDIRLQAAEGRIKIADTWEEIAGWMGVAPGVLKGTIKEYNGCCEHGYDAVFNKERRFLVPLRHPPYYAIPGRVSIVVTHGGIIINQHTEALDAEGRAIPGLYAAGVEVAGTEANTYNMYLSGHSFGFAVYSGRIAGENAARFVLGK